MIRWLSIDGADNGNADGGAILLRFPRTPAADVGRWLQGHGFERLGDRAWSGPAAHRVVIESCVYLLDAEVEPAAA